MSWTVGQKLAFSPWLTLHRLFSGKFLVLQSSNMEAEETSCLVLHPLSLLGHFVVQLHVLLHPLILLERFVVQLHLILHP